MDNPTLSLRDQGIQALRSGNLDSAIDLLAQAVAADGQDAEAQAFLGVAYSQMGHYAHAKRALETAVELQPQEPLYRFNLAVSMELLGDVQGAAMVYHETLQLDPDHAPAQEKLAALQTPLSVPSTPDAPWQQGPQTQPAPSPHSGYAPELQPPAYFEAPEVARPFGLSLIVILSALGSVLGVIAGIMMLVGVGAAIASPAGGTANSPVVGLGAVLASLGAFLILWSLGTLVVGHFLWKGFNWARIVFIVLASIGILGNVAQCAMQTGSGTVFFQLVVGLCFLFILNSQPARDYCCH